MLVCPVSLVPRRQGRLDATFSGSAGGGKIPRTTWSSGREAGLWEEPYLHFSGRFYREPAFSLPQAEESGAWPYNNLKKETRAEGGVYVCVVRYYADELSCCQRQPISGLELAGAVSRGFRQWRVPVRTLAARAVA